MEDFYPGSVDPTVWRVNIRLEMGEYRHQTYRKFYANDLRRYLTKAGFTHSDIMSLSYDEIDELWEMFAKDGRPH